MEQYDPYDNTNGMDMSGFPHSEDFEPDPTPNDGAVAMPAPTSLDLCDRDARHGMTRKDLALEMIRRKRAHPVYDRKEDVTYASISELARTERVTPQKMYKRLRTRYGRMRYDLDAITQDYFDLKACETVDEYVLHYIRKHYDEVYTAHLHVISLTSILENNRLRVYLDKPQILNIRRDGIYDVFPFDHQGDEKDTFVCSLDEVGA